MDTHRNFPTTSTIFNVDTEAGLLLKPERCVHGLVEAMFSSYDQVNLYNMHY